MNVNANRNNHQVIEMFNVRQPQNFFRNAVVVDPPAPRFSRNNCRRSLCAITLASSLTCAVMLGILISADK